MFKSQGSFKKAENTYIGLETVIDGNILCRGSLRVDGKVKGDVNAKGDMIIGGSAVIAGNISAKKITVGGAVEGNITSEDSLRILSTAKLTGDIYVSALISDKGGLFTGRCSILPPPKKVLEAVFEDRRKNNDPYGNQAVNA